MATAKLAGLKSKMTIPKLELNALRLATRIRVLEIRSIIDHLKERGYGVQLGHIASQENPADCAIRGVDKSQFHDHLWWKGPQFLAQPVEDWESGIETKLACKASVKQHQLAWISSTTLTALPPLNPYTDHQRILRCKGRLGRSTLEEQTKFPMLVLQRKWLSRLIITDCHREIHASISHTMCRVRERYWIPKLRAEATSTIRRCTECQKMSNLPYKYPQQGHLPARRVTKSRPFEHVRLDYFGPITVKSDGGATKCYGCIITCMVARLIHLDLNKFEIPPPLQTGDAQVDDPDHVTPAERLASQS
ncbi:hypothetical protein RB195_025260 [Necator americanus]|uniref:Integrase zinc-binding domain-containing protein n=1 Tax=Necator americanus TaxID=51031 RepID=A0ABR1ETT0_NECAM